MVWIIAQQIFTPPTSCLPTVGQEYLPPHLTVVFLGHVTCFGYKGTLANGGAQRQTCACVVWLEAYAPGHKLHKKIMPQEASSLSLSLGKDIHAVYSIHLRVWS